MEVVRQNIALTQKEIAQMKARREQGTVLQNDITRYEFQLQSLELTLTKLTDASTIINHQLVTTLHLPEQTVIVPDNHCSRYVAADGDKQQPWHPSVGSGRKSCRTEGEAGKGRIIAFGGCRGRKSSLWSLYTRPHPERLQCKRVVCRDRRKVQPW